MENGETSNECLLSILLEPNHMEIQGHGMTNQEVTMILYEVLRLHLPTVFFIRTLQKDMKLGNLSLPAVVKVTMPISFIHQDGDDAKQFKPERFSEGIAKATQGQVSFFPFGWGPKMCIGQNFALLEAKIMLSLLLQHFSFDLSPAYAHAPSVICSTLQPKHGAHIVISTISCT
ncbi:11-oxo-beta-amyrin 30-oxidase, partial [Mucuna pruriens]